MLQCIILCASLLATGSLANVGQYITPCHQTDSECILKSAEHALPYFVKGIDEFGVSSLSPLHTKEINSITDGLQLTLKNTEVRGLEKTKFNKIERDVAKSTILLDFETPIECTGNYKIDGKLFLLDVFGEGNCKIVGEKIRFLLTLKLKQITKGGKKYYKVTGFDYNYEPVSRFTFKFENLYNGDKTQAQPIENLLNENWKDIMLGIGKPIVKEIVSGAVDNFNKFFQNAPVEEVEIV